MRAEHVFRVPRARDEVLERVRSRLAATGWRDVADRDAGLEARRGSRSGRLLSLRVEEWPTTLKLSFVAVSDSETGVIARYEVDTGMHLVGATDRAVLEAEMALLARFLVNGTAPELHEAVAPLRRPVHVAAILNMTLASAVIAVVGILAGHSPLMVGGAAFVVALLDGLVILAFGDLVLEGSRRIPSLRDPGPESRESVAVAGEGA